MLESAHRITAEKLEHAEKDIMTKEAKIEALKQQFLVEHEEIILKNQEQKEDLELTKYSLEKILQEYKN
jgi:hypothetical protein